jgi:hypothetical protein
MTKLARRYLLSALLTAGAAASASAQQAGMQMPTNALLLAQLDAGQVVGGSTSHATGTGAFLLNPIDRMLSYSLTYAGLGSRGAQLIALHNFGRGRDGPVIRILCSPGTQPCPGGSAATIRGQFERGQGTPLDNALVGEFASGRIYVEIEDVDGKPEIRGQLGQNGAMVRISNYTAELVPASGGNAGGSGTAVVSETYLPGGKVAVFYAATIANTSGPPVSVILTGAPPVPARPLTAPPLPRATVLSAPGASSGGTITGSYQADAASPRTMLASRLARTPNGRAMVVVTTNRFRGGELVGNLVPVR